MSIWTEEWIRAVAALGVGFVVLVLTVAMGCVMYRLTDGGGGARAAVAAVGLAILIFLALVALVALVSVAP